MHGTHHCLLYYCHQMRLLLLVCLFAVAVAQRGFFQLPTFNNRNRGQSFRRPSRPQQRPQQNVSY